MNKISRTKDKNFTTICNVFLREKKMSLKAKGLLSLIMSLPDDWDFSVAGISKITKEGKNTIYTTINELKEHGYCTAIQLRDVNGVILGYDYTFTDKPLPKNPDMENPDTENPDTDFGTQINKEETKYEITKEREEKIKRKAENLKKDLERRQGQFYNSLVPYLSQYPKEMIRDFFDYWSEPNKTNTRMRFEMQSTWEVGRRLTTWAKNSDKFKSSNNNYGRETITDKINRTIEEANEFSRKLRENIGKETEMGFGDSEDIW